MARFPSYKPAKTVEEEEARTETKMNQDDPSVETSINPLDSSSSFSDWYLGSDSVSWSGSHESRKDDNEVDQFEDDEEEGVNFISDWVISQEPPRLKTEEEIPVNVAMLPVGFVLSVKGKQVMIEGKEKHNNLLLKGSFLWITETRVPLGSVDEIMGTVERPCYSVRLESESQLPEGINKGTQVSLIVIDSVQHDKKGCDASSGDEIECLDDEIEAEYRKLQKKMAKLGMTSEQKPEVLMPQALPSPNLSALMPQAIAGTVMPCDSQLSPVMPQAIASVPQHHPFSTNPEISQQNPIQPPVLRIPMPNSTIYSPQDFRSEMVLGLGKSKNRRAEQTLPSPNLSNSPVMMPQAIASVPQHKPLPTPSRPEINQQSPIMYSPQDFRSEMLQKPWPELKNFNPFPPPPPQVSTHRHHQRKPKLHHRGGKGRDQ